MAPRGYRNAQGYRIGSWHGRAKLTEEQVARARAEHQPGVRGRGILALAKRYGVAMATMRDVLSYATWPHVLAERIRLSAEMENDGEAIRLESRI